jgi:transposase
VGVECGGLGGDPIKGIARVVGCSKNTVRKALSADQPPAYRRRPRGSVVDAVEPRIRELLQACPTMPATVIAERIEWSYSIRTLSARVSETAPGVSAAGSVVSDQLCGLGDRSV